MERFSVPVEVRCRRCRAVLARVCPCWPPGRVRGCECGVCGEAHQVARSSCGNVYISAGLEVDPRLRPRLL